MSIKTELAQLRDENERLRTALEEQRAQAHRFRIALSKLIPDTDPEYDISTFAHHNGRFADND